jgi:hypothetical protein
MRRLSHETNQINRQEMKTRGDSIESQNALRVQNARKRLFMKTESLQNFDVLYSSKVTTTPEKEVR